MDDFTDTRKSPSSPGLVLHLQVEEDGRVQVVCFNSSEEARIRDWLDSTDVETQAAQLIQAARTSLGARRAGWAPGDVLPKRVA